MSADFKNFRTFVKVINAGSTSRAKSLWRMAQPAISPKILALEAHFRQEQLWRVVDGGEA